MGNEGRLLAFRAAGLAPLLLATHRGIRIPGYFGTPNLRGVKKVRSEVHRVVWPSRFLQSLRNSQKKAFIVPQ